MTSRGLGGNLSEAGVDEAIGAALLDEARAAARARMASVDLWSGPDRIMTAILGMLRARRRIYPGKDGVASLNADRQRAQRDVAERRYRRHVPLAQYRVGASDPVTARVFQVDAVGVLDEAIGGGRRGVEHLLVGELPACE